jgi:hypothetical protein
MTWSVGKGFWRKGTIVLRTRCRQRQQGFGEGDLFVAAELTGKRGFESAQSVSHTTANARQKLPVQ